MAYYDDRQYSHHDHYARPPPEYDQNPDYHESRHGGHNQQTDVVHHPQRSRGTRDEYYRDYPPPDLDYEYEYGHSPYSRGSQGDVRRSHSISGGGHYNDSEYSHSRPQRSRRKDDRRDRDNYSYSPSTSRSPPRRRRSLSERAMGALGLGSAAATASKHQTSSRGRSRGRDRRSYSYSPSPSRGSRHHREKNDQKISQAIKAALTAGAVEAFRVRKEPGDWTGEKGRRVLTAAITAGGTDGLVDRDPNKHSTRHIIESTLAGLATNRVVNGPRSSHSGSRRRSRSRSRGSGAKDAALAGILAAAGKEAYSRFRNRSQSRHRERSSSRDSYDHDSSRARRSKKRSKSVTDYISEGMGALGLSDNNNKEDRRRRHHRSSRRDDSSDDGQYSDSGYHRRHESPRRVRHSRDVSRSYYVSSSGARSGDEAYRSSTTRAKRSRPDSQSTREYHHSLQRNDSDSANSTDEEKKHKRLTKETLWATGLATAATIHAAHSLAENVGKHKERQKLLREGEISKDEARRRRMRNQLSDAASVGVAAMSVQSALSEWKHFDDKRRERSSFKKERKTRNSQSQTQRAQSLNHQPRPRTVFPDEIEENYSTADHRSRSVGRSPTMVPR